MKGAYMASVSASQYALAKAKADFPTFTVDLHPDSNSPNIVWVVFSGGKVIGVFKDWPSASAKIGEIEQVQLRNWLDSRRDHDDSFTQS
jgi:hypothetical protein